MNYRREIKKQAKTRRLGTLLLAILIAYAVIIPLQILSGMKMINPLFSNAEFMNSVVAIIFLPIYVVGIRAAALMVSRGLPITVLQPFKNGFDNYGNKLGGFLWKSLWVALWQMLAIVPFFLFILFNINRIVFLPDINYFTDLISNNIAVFALMIAATSILLIPSYIKALSYSFTEYILAEYPSVGARDALKLSMRITDGRKWTIFVFDLSFIGWFLLVPITFGLILLYVVPYYETARAILYDSLKAYALNNGVVARHELGITRV